MIDGMLAMAMKELERDKASQVSQQSDAIIFFPPRFTPEDWDLWEFEHLFIYEPIAGRRVNGQSQMAVRVKV